MPQRQRRPAVSEITGTLLTIVITIIAGAAVFGYVNAQAGNSERALGASVGSTNSFLSERFVIIDVNYSTSSLSIWVYNNGQVVLQPVQVLVYDSARALYVQYNATKVTNLNNPSACNQLLSAYPNLEKPPLYNPTLSSTQQTSGVVNIRQGSVAKLSLTLPSCITSTYTTGKTYYVNVLGLFGNVLKYFQTK